MNKTSLWLLLWIIALAAGVGLSTYLTKQNTPLSLHLNIRCSEYVADGYDENGNWVSMGSGSEITLDGKLNYKSPSASTLKEVTAKITVYDTVTQLQSQDEILIPLDPKGTSVFTKEVDFQEQVEMPSCADYKYGIAFYSPEGKLVSHEGALENSIENFQSFLYSTPTN